MSDIDFDELDRAVNSLIAKTPSPDTDNTDDSPDIEADISIIDSSAGPVEPVMAEPVQRSAPPPISIADRTVTPRSLATQRSSGRFMDVIHPSTDMRSASTPHVATPSVPVKPPTRYSAPVSPKPNIEAVSRPITPVRPDIDIDDEPDSFQALESPFISGAKLEKRPLGAFSDEPQPVTPPVPSIELPSAIEVTATPVVVVDSSDELAYDPDNDPLPEELQSDLLEIESGNADEINTVAPEAIPELEVAPIAQKSANPPLESESTAPISIIQQYKEQKPNVDEKPGAIFDTNVYHKAINTDSKKKSGWLWVVWIALLLVVGVGAGAVAYFYVLPLIK